jgi:hypothetical protein
VRGNGQATAPETEQQLPASIRTLFFCGGQTFAVDEDIRGFDVARRAFLAAAETDPHAALWLHAERREICFSLELMRLFVFAKSREVAVQVVDEPDVVRRLNQGR